MRPSLVHAIRCETEAILCAYKAPFLHYYLTEGIDEEVW